MSFAVQGGGTDLVFPHHEMSAVQASALTGEWPFAQAYLHQAMVGLDGEKMSKSRGNLVLVSQLRAAGVDPMAVRLVLLGHHYATPWFWTQDDLDAAPSSGWPAGGRPSPRRPGTDARVALADVRAALAEDLNAPRAVAAIDRWVAAQQDPPAGTVLDPDAPDLIRRTADALLGVRL